MQTMDIYLQKEIEKSFIFNTPQEANNICGFHDEFLQCLRGSFPCCLVVRGLVLYLTGEEKIVSGIMGIMKELQYLHGQGVVITRHEVEYSINMMKKDEGQLLHNVFSHTILVTARGKHIRPKTLGQCEYIDMIKNNLITLCKGPAGTGKTYLAVAMAAAAIKKHEVEKIILTRPVMEAGEKLGFLPGDLQDKVDPYLRPLYDALQDVFGFEAYQKMLDKGLIEIAPLAYMRGRTLDNAFIILDEAQNTTSRQMKMFLTRMGFSSRMVITGDLSQADLPDNIVSGLKEACDILQHVKGITIMEFSADQVIRHDVVARIVAAYEKARR